MATTREFPLHQDLTGGVETSQPAHLLGPNQWRTQHNFRSAPQLQQVPHKKLLYTAGVGDVLWQGMVPSGADGHGVLVTLTAGQSLRNQTTAMASLNYDAKFRRFATAIYNGKLYYTNDLNTIRCNDGLTDIPIQIHGLDARAARYLTFWYDHAIIAYLPGLPNRVAISDLYDFTTFSPAVTNEADFYDFVEWQLPDYPAGITGLGKLRGQLWVYTPSALIPMDYVGKPKVIQIRDQGVISRTGNTFPYTLVCLDTIHFYFDAVEGTFFAFDGQQVHNIGDPVRQYLADNLNPSFDLASKMYGYVDTAMREIWWPFCSTASTGAYDKAVVFNYRFRKWFTASVENVTCFCPGGQSAGEITTFNDQIGNYNGSMYMLGTGANLYGRQYGSTNGQVLTDAVAGETYVPEYDDPVLETGDFNYGDIRMVKENDGMVINATLDSTTSTVDVYAQARPYLGDTTVAYPSTALASWKPQLENMLVTYPAIANRILRYKFIFRNTNAALMSAFSEMVRRANAER